MAADSDRLLQELRDPSEAVRKRAIVQLSRDLDMRALPRLMEVVKVDESLEVRFLAKKVLYLYRDRMRQEQTAPRPAAVEAPPRPGPATGDRPAAMPAAASELRRIHQALEGEEPSLRVKAIMALVQLKDPEALPLLRRLDRREEVPRVRAALALALGLLGGQEEVPLLAAYLAEEDPRVRGNAIEALKMLAGVSATQPIAKLLKDPDPKVKAAARETLLGFPRDKLVGHLKDLLGSTDAAQRDVGAYALVKLELPETVPLIVGALSDPEIGIRLKARNALVNLAKQGCPDAMTILERHAGQRESPDHFMTMSVIEKRPKLDELADPRPRERVKAVRAIIDAKDASRVPDILHALLREKDGYVRSSLVVALGRLGAHEAVGSLKVFTEDADARIRASAVEALGLIGGNEVFPLLIPFLDDPNNRVRANAVVALGACAYIQLRMPLLKMVRAGEVLMRRSAIYAIVQLRKAEMIPLLGELLDDREQVVKDKALDAAKLLASEGLPEARKLLAERGLAT